jgi:hypothetical protein
MLLRNYDNYSNLISLNRSSYGDKIGDTSKFGDGYLNVKDINGTVRDVTYYYSLSPFYTWNTGGNGCGTLFCFGSGSTPVDYDDYKLESLYKESTDYSIVSNSITHTTPTYDEEDNTWENTISQAFTALKELTINEIGVYQKFVYKGSSTTTALIYRKVLDTPIVVPANANVVLSFTSKVNACSNKPANYEASVSVE